jgi:hypothetical protein
MKAGFVPDAGGAVVGPRQDLRAVAAELDILDRLLVTTKGEEFLADGRVPLHRDQNVRGLDIAMDQALVMGVLHPLAHRDEQFQAIFDGQRADRNTW